MFELYEVGELVDGELRLVCSEKVPANIERSFVPLYKFEMMCGEKIVGAIKLRIGDNDDLRMFSGQIGYNVRDEFRGHRYAARSCVLLLPLARRHGMRELWITCDENNCASRRTCELAGATWVEIVDLPPYHDLYRRGGRRSCRYRIAL